MPKIEALTGDGKKWVLCETIFVFVPKKVVTVCSNFLFSSATWRTWLCLVINAGTHPIFSIDWFHSVFKTITMIWGLIQPAATRSRYLDSTLESNWVLGPLGPRSCQANNAVIPSKTGNNLEVFFKLWYIMKIWIHNNETSNSTMDRWFDIDRFPFCVNFFAAPKVHHWLLVLVIFGLSKWRQPFPPDKTGKNSNADVPTEWASKLGECWIMPCKRQPSYTSAIPKGWVLILIQSDFIILLLNKLLDFILQVSWAQPAYKCTPGLCTGRRSKQLILEESMNTVHHGASRCMLSSAGWPGMTWRTWKPEGHSSGWERDSTPHSAWTSFDICVWLCMDIQGTMHPTP